MFADLHLHSSCSDGRLTPPEVIAAVAAAGVRIAALTDHDTTAGLESAALCAKQRGIILIPGIEMTTYAAGEVVHMLGLQVDPANPELQSANAVANAVWARNQQVWVTALASQGYELAYARDFPDGPVRLPVLIERLCRKGVAHGDPVRCHALFREFFAALPPAAYATLAQPSDAAGIVSRAGGVAILAHPYSLKKESLLREILAQCDGLEARYAAYDAAQQTTLLRLCEEAGKLYSCGSDYHGYFTEQYVNPAFELPLPLARRWGLADVNGAQAFGASHD